MARGRPLLADRADRNLHIRCLKEDLETIQSSVRDIKDQVSVLRKSGYKDELPSRTAGSIICFALDSYRKYMESVLVEEKEIAEQRQKVFSLLKKESSLDASEICKRTGFPRPLVLRCIRDFFEN